MSIILKPIFSKKSQLYFQREKVYVFFVNPHANKFQIKKNFEDLFNVKVKKVRTSLSKALIEKGHLARKLPGKIRTKVRKKAFIVLKEGYQLSLFDNPLNNKPN